MKRHLYKSSKYIFKNPYKRGNSIEWIQSGEIFFNRLEQLIDAAAKEIHLQTYIFSSDETGQKIMEALLRAARRNVLIYIIADAFGSNELRPDTILKMQQAGIRFRFYGRLLSKSGFHIGRRMHHKIIVIDGHTSIVGGINISNNYNSLQGHQAWLDFAVIMKGNISSRLRYICMKRWKSDLKSLEEKRRFLLMPVKLPAGGKSLIRARRNDFTRNRFEISISYREAIRRSTSSILLIGGYFLPGRRSRKLMRKAVDRGVRVSVIVSEKSDVRLLVNARRYLYNWLLKNGIDVYEYIPSNVHGKVLITDEKWTSIGSYDLNNLSTYSNIELNVDIQDETFSAGLARHIHSIMEGSCKKITRESLALRSSLFYKFKIWFSYRLVKTLFVISVILAGKEKEL